VSDVHEIVLPRLHGRLHDTRRELDDARHVARMLALALDGEVDLRHGRRHRHTVVRDTADALHLAREAGLL
jgi:hypothetical protein